MRSAKYSASILAGALLILAPASARPCGGQTATTSVLGWTRDGSKLVLEVSAREVGYDKGELVQVPADRQVTDRREIVVTGIEASSTLPQTGRYSYVVENLTDDRRGSAWCEGAKGGGVGEWVEMKFEAKKPDARCGVHFFGTNPCYASSRSACKNNGAVVEVGIGRCGSTKTDATLELEEADWSAALCEREMDDETWGIPEGDVRWLCERPLRSTCVRFTITKVRPGAKFTDTCMSTLRPYRLWCDLAHR